MLAARTTTDGLVDPAARRRVPPPACCWFCGVSFAAEIKDADDQHRTDIAVARALPSGTANRIVAAPRCVLCGTPMTTATAQIAHAVPVMLPPTTALSYAP
jgi:hypothetical protein